MLRKAPAHRLLSPGLLLACGLLFSLITIFVYWPGLYGPFLLDDLQSITPTQMDHFSWSNLISVSLQNQTGPLGRPLSTATLALNGIIFGNTPFYFKVVNLVFHLLCGLSIGLFVHLTISFLPKRRNIAAPTALLTTFIWLIHPLQVSTVLYVVQRMTELSALFTIIGLNVYLYGRLKQVTHQKHWLVYLLISFLFFFPLAVFSKETGILFPWYVFCLEYFILKFACPTESQRFKLVHFHRIFSLSLVLMALLYFYYKLPIYFATYAEKDYTLIARLLTESKALIFYLSLIFRPMLSQMGLYHDDFAISHNFDGAVWISLAVLTGMVLCIFFCKRKAPVVSFGLAWFLISHVIESTLIPLELVFEHRNYLALLGVILIPCYYFTRFMSQRQGIVKVVLWGATFGLLILLTSLTIFRALGWSSTANFLKEAKIYHPLSARTHIEISNWQLGQKNYALAINELETAFTIQPNNVGILLHQILIGCQTEQIPDALYRQVELKIKASAITPYILMVLNQIIQNIVNQQCHAVNKDQMQVILENAIANPTLRYKPLYKAMLYHLQAGIALTNNNIALCLTLLMKSYEAYPQRLDPLIQKAVIEWNHKLYKEAHATREMIKENTPLVKTPHDKIQALDKLLQSRN